MPNDNSFTNLLRNLLAPNVVTRLWGSTLSTSQNDPVELSRSLLTARGQASGVAIADRVLSLVEEADEADLTRYFAALRDEFEVDLDEVLATAARAQTERLNALNALQRAAEPPRQELFRRLNAAPRGTARLVDLRRKLLAALRKDQSLALIDSDLRHLLRSWFNRGFLVAARIDWHSPADLLEKIIAYESVHAIDSWDALRERLVPPDRRCFAFFHPAMPNDPLIFVEVALGKGLAESIQDILASPRELVPAEKADTAIFYSISNCHKGLAGISFGAFLIKQVASDLKAELPNLKTFATLSPVPGLSKWMKERKIPDALLSKSEDLVTAAAAYLAEAKNPSGHPRDPVARFHLSNGAELYRINAGADVSAKGLAQSHGVMVNYLYELDRVEARHESFAATAELALSRDVSNLLNRPRPWDEAGQVEGRDYAAEPSS